MEARGLIGSDEALAIAEESGVEAGPAVGGQERSRRSSLRLLLLACATVCAAVLVVEHAKAEKNPAARRPEPRPASKASSERSALVLATPGGGGGAAIEFYGFELVENMGCENWNDLLLTTKQDAPTVNSARECAHLCQKNYRCREFNFQPEGLGSGRCPASLEADQRSPGSCYMYRERVQPSKCIRERNTCWDLYVWKNPYSSRHLESVCPVLGALMLNGDLVPDENSMITKEQTRQAFLRVGISPTVANAMVSVNMRSERCPTCPIAVNPFKMNVIHGDVHHNPHGDDHAAHEHFRSTGIRDNVLTPSRYDLAAANCLTSPPLTWNLERAFCFSNTFDCDGPTCVDGPNFKRYPSSDIAEDRRPATCPNGTSGIDKCNSALFGSINLLFQEFGTPTGEKATIPNDQFRAVWIEGAYPPDFAARSPRHCAQVEATDSHYGCATCLSQVGRGDPVGKERYCRCMVGRELPAGSLAGVSEYSSWCMPSGISLIVAGTGEFDEASGVNMSNGAALSLGH